MITINYRRFGTKGFQLRLCLNQDGETKFINVAKLLKGAIKKRHWNQQKQVSVFGLLFHGKKMRIRLFFVKWERIGERGGISPSIVKVGFIVIQVIIWIIQVFISVIQVIV